MFFKYIIHIYMLKYIQYTVHRYICYTMIWVYDQGSEGINNLNSKEIMEGEKNNE